MNLLITILIVVALLGLAFFGFALKILFSKERKFPNMHVGSNKNLSARGITCAQSWDKMEQKSVRKIKYENLSLGGNQ
jgi:hypothetical protein